MKPYLLAFPIAILLVLPVCAAEAPRLCIRVSLGGTHLIGLGIEYRFGKNSIGASVGSSLIFEGPLQDLSLSLHAKRYLREGDLSPYVGIGIWDLIAFPGDGFGQLVFLNALLGTDWNFATRHSLGVEFDLNYAIYVGWTGDEEHPSLNRRFLILPAAYYNYQLSAPP